MKKSGSFRVLELHKLQTRADNVLQLEIKFCICRNPLVKVEAIYPFV